MNMTITKAVKPEVWEKLMDDEGSLISPKLWAAGRKIHWRVPKANRIGDVEDAIYNICHQLNDYQYFSFHHHKYQPTEYQLKEVARDFAKAEAKGYSEEHRKGVYGILTNDRALDTYLRFNEKLKSRKSLN